MYIRTTTDCYDIMGFYYGQWETVTTETTWKAAKEMLKCYKENERNTAFKIKKYREKIE